MHFTAHHSGYRIATLSRVQANLEQVRYRVTTIVATATVTNNVISHVVGSGIATKVEFVVDKK